MDKIDGQRNAKESDVQEGDEVLVRRLKKTNKFDTTFNPIEHRTNPYNIEPSNSFTSLLVPSSTWQCCHELQFSTYPTDHSTNQINKPKEDQIPTPKQLKVMAKKLVPDLHIDRGLPAPSNLSSSSSESSSSNEEAWHRQKH